MKSYTPKNPIPCVSTGDSNVTIQWDQTAIETLQGLERYSLVKAIENSQRLIKEVMVVAVKNAEGKMVTKLHVQKAITTVFEESESK